MQALQHFMNFVAKIPVKCTQQVNEFANTSSVRSWFSCLSAKILQKVGTNILTDCNHFNSCTTTVLALSKEAQVYALSRYSFLTSSNVSDSGACGKHPERHICSQWSKTEVGDPEYQMVFSYVYPSVYFVFIWTVKVCQKNYVELNRRPRQDGEKKRYL